MAKSGVLCEADPGSAEAKKKAMELKRELQRLVKTIVDEEEEEGDGLSSSSSSSSQQRSTPKQKQKSTTETLNSRHPDRKTLTGSKNIRKTMSCSVAVSNSPVFSPSRVSSSLFCKSSALSSSPETLISSPSSPLRLRLHRPLTALRPPIDGLCSVSSNSASTSAAAAASSPPPALKRKRPARLDIPIASLSFAAPLSAAEGCQREAVEVEGDGYSVYCKRGRREAMEDRYSAIVDLEGDSKQAFFGVFDGHGGAVAAEFAAENMGKNILDEVIRRGDGEFEEAVKHGYLNTDSEFIKEEARGGSCCVTALVRNGNLVVSNAGDCRAVISRGGVAEALTSDHRPSRIDEKHRIESLGGYVDCCHGVWRIQGSLAVSRGIGDNHLKKWVIAEPDTKVLPIKPEDEFLILASDGLWDKVNNQEAVNIAHSYCIGKEKPEPLSACKELVGLSASRGSADDISVMLIQLSRYA